MGGVSADTPWPVELRLHRSEKRLEIDFEDGARFDLPAELLRVESPSAEIRGHGAAEPKIPGGKRDVAITGIDPVGNYAVRLHFDDGHNTGLFNWRLLYQLGQEKEARFTAYLAALEKKGLSRDP